jgi:hypothetical protein
VTGSIIRDPWRVRSVILKLETGEELPAQSADEWATWSATVTFRAQQWGNQKLTAVATMSSGASDTNSLEVQVENWVDVSLLSSPRVATLDYSLRVRLSR